MNWKKALLIVVVAGFALVFFVVAAAGVLATAGLATAAVAISESGIVQAFEEVADGAEQLTIQVDENSITFTDPESGKSRVVVTEGDGRRGRVDLNLPEITITDPDGESRVIVPSLRGQGEFTVPQITITDPDSGQSRVIVPDVERPNVDVRVPRVVWDDDMDWVFYGPESGLRVVGSIFRGLFNLAALVLIVAGAYLLLRNRRQVSTKLEEVEKSA